ncbi:phosphate/phosphite/phosphonate ABC transporter substrate-binding protein [Aeoliella sp. ICT_H6.2]|uniref:Phosphate/phosphite/phosphonate ABC transporter substrate-binding protein n=1 Tax=Aeoliella straminimaris TaxID=2954799 RepID=A0A9X2F5X1_9BACT|nr:phosphate/phosphite/phosphonate ABC transporter substrate-binding protein [Aeoliella straminimaris]MCO6042815.1 phosphate/phosphite/phosphonate ABC transporter substrate-binding protein [Aeoliella straminimaris]
MSDADTPTKSTPPSVSLARVFKAVLPVALVLLVVWWVVQSLPDAAQQKLENSELTRLLGKPVKQTKLEGWTDSDGDLVADSPADDQCITPETLVFSYVASDDAGDAPEAWQPFLDALSEATGIPTEYKHFEKAADQLEAIGNGELHVTAVNTGAVPAAVNTAGFVPVSTFGHEGSFGYTMDLLVAADSPIKKVEELKGKKITFVRPTSNSGFKAALVYLMDEHDMLPERDYKYGFSMGHDTSAQEVASGKTDAAPVASDLLEGYIEEGTIEDGKVRVLYESERFPPVALGYAYNLSPAIREAVAKLLTEYDWQGTPLMEEYGTPERDEFVAISYKDDWANVRRIDDVIEKARQNAK